MNDRPVQYFHNQSMHMLFKRQSEEIFMDLHGSEVLVVVNSNICVLFRFIMLFLKIVSSFISWV